MKGPVVIVALVLGSLSAMYLVVRQRRRGRSKAASGEGVRRPLLGLRLVCISDTHGAHRKLGELPAGDVLIHAGDWTRYGRKADVVDFNAWLGELPHAHKIVVNGNHECNAPWKARTAAILANATFLRDAAVTLPGSGLRVHGCEFAWPMKTSNPTYDAVADGSVDILICHGPARGHADGGSGCAEVLRLAERLRPRAQRLRTRERTLRRGGDGHGPCGGDGGAGARRRGRQQRHDDRIVRV